MRKVVLSVGMVLLLALAAGAWLLADLNRFRPQAEAWVVEETGLAIEIGGDLGWRLVPAPTVSAAAVRAADRGWRVDEWHYSPVSDHHSVRGLQFEAPGADGRCDLEFASRRGASTRPQAKAPGIVPVQALLRFNGNGSCRGVRLSFADQRFEDLTAKFDVAKGVASLGLQAPNVFGGTASALIEVDANAEPLDWTVRFNADRLQAQRLEPWLNEAVEWDEDADIAYAGEFQLQGNSVADLASSIIGESRLRGGPGRMGAPFLDQIKKAASPFARGNGKAAPGPVQYQSLAGTWSIKGATQRLSIELDNLALTAKGEYHFDEDRLDLAAKVAIEEGTGDSAFAASPLLTGIRIPLRCTGTLAEPGCELDGKAVRRLLAEAAKDGSEMQQRVEAIIDEKVPPKQRQAARAVLRLLGGSIEDERP